ncbi:MAG: cytochrome c oxidase subunit 3, partial [Bacteroidota bacterium]|nr:cytochrome c oxidase subunit 3 [Bacteroidota bacterium]
VDFALPKSFVYSTFVIVLSSITIQLSKYFLNKEKSKNRSLIFLSTTFILGIIFLVLQFNGFNNLIDLGYYFAGAQSNVTTSFIYVLAFVHLLHLIAGLVVVSVLFYNTYFDNYSDSILGFSLGVTFWHFLDLLWVYLFIFLYFIG